MTKTFETPHGYVTLIGVEAPQECSSCHQMLECRPYGKDGAQVCWHCSQADPIEAVKQFSRLRFKQELTTEEAQLVLDEQYKQYPELRVRKH